MNIAVIGGGFTGLAAAYELTKRGHAVTMFERDAVLGGLAHGFREPNWQWHLEYAYHHWFTNDHAVFSLIQELDLGDKLIIKRPITANLLPNSAGSPDPIGTTSAPEIVQLDSPLHLLLFPKISIIDKIRTACLLAFLKLNPFWQPLEGITAEQLLISIGGKRAYEIIWKPLLVGKFGDLAPTVAASWFWARIKKRTPSLCYIEGGFQTLVSALADAITKHGGTIYTNTTVTSIKKVSSIKYQVSCKNQTAEFDRILLTIPTPIALKLLPQLSNTYAKPLLSIPHLHAQTLILETKEPILKNVYWLSVTDQSYPFLAVVAHTNFMDKKYYGNHHLTYFGNYLPQGHPYLSMNKNELLKIFLPFIKRLLPITDNRLRITNSYLFVGPFAQPVHQLHYSQKAPPLVTPIPGVYLANLDSIYPWDRGTNYAVELGIRAANRIMNSES